MGDAFSVPFILSCFFPIQILIFFMLRNNADVRRCSWCSYFELALPVVKLQTLYGVKYDPKIYRKYFIKLNEAYSTNFRDNFLKFTLHTI